MIRKTSVLGLLAMLFCLPFASGCEGDADLILRNGSIYTVNPAQPWAEALAVRDGEIVHIGDNAGADSLEGPLTRVIDLQGRMAMPGLHDSHVHILEANHAAGGTCPLTPGLNPEFYIPGLRACSRNQIGTDWVLGYGYSIDKLLAAGRSPREILDEAIPNQPAAMLEETSHSVWVNSRALAEAGIDASTPDPIGGVIMRDATTGEATGLLLDNAGEVVMDLAFAPNAVMRTLNYQALLTGLTLLKRNGITSVADARAYWKRDYVEAWQRVENEGRLTARAVVALWAYANDDDDEQLAKLKSIYTNDASSRLRFSQVKMYADGLIQNTTAALIEPYLSPTLAEPLGLEYFSETRLERYVRELELVGFDAHIHTIGDRGVRQALDAIEAATAANGPRDRRHRLTHVELAHPDDVPRFAELGAIADIQMSSAFVEPENAVDLHPFLGPERTAERWLPIRDLSEAGARVVLSSDWDVGSLSPFKGMERALTRGDQSLPSVDAAIRAYTIDAAYLMRQEDRVGSLELGKLADVVILDRNLLETAPASLGETRVLMTLLEGEEIFRALGYNP